MTSSTPKPSLWPALPKLGPAEAQLGSGRSGPLEITITESEAEAEIGL